MVGIYAPQPSFAQGAVKLQALAKALMREGILLGSSVAHPGHHPYLTQL